MGKACVGVDIGSSAIKAVRLKPGRRTTRLLDFGIEPLPPQAIVDGSIMDQGAVVEALGRLRTALGIGTMPVATAISGHSVIVKKISLAPMTREELDQQILLEAETHIPFKRDEVELDYQVVSSRGATTGQMDVILVAAKKDIIADYTQVIRDAKLLPAVMDVAAFSVQNAFEAGYGTSPATNAVALLHVGNAISHVNVVVGGASVFTRDVTVGGAAFTEEIQRRLHVGYDEAEALKLAASEPLADGTVIPPAVHTILDEIADSTATKLQRSIDFFLASARDMPLSRVYVSGGSARMPALIRALEQKARAPVEILDPFRGISVDANKLDPGFVSAHAAEGAIALGLALRRPGDEA